LEIAKLGKNAPQPRCVLPVPKQDIVFRFGNEKCSRDYGDLHAVCMDMAYDSRRSITIAEEAQATSDGGTVRAREVRAVRVTLLVKIIFASYDPKTQTEEGERDRLFPDVLVSPSTFSNQSEMMHTHIHTHTYIYTMHTHEVKLCIDSVRRDKHTGTHTTQKSARKFLHSIASSYLQSSSSATATGGHYIFSLSEFPTGRLHQLKRMIGGYHSENYCHQDYVEQQRLITVISLLRNYCTRSVP
jgi:hypothetical protein